LDSKIVIVGVDVHVRVVVDGFWRLWLRSGAFEGRATAKPGALPEDTYSASCMMLLLRRVAVCPLHGAPCTPLRLGRPATDLGE